MSKIPGRQFADLSAGRLEYASSGVGQPVTIFINGGGPANMDSWRKVYPQVANVTSAIAYNRFGDGASDKVQQPQTSSIIGSTLRELLEYTGLKPPYVLVGHSIGGLYCSLFARLFPPDVAGVVLVDSSHPDQWNMMREQRGLLGAVNRLFFMSYRKFNPSKASEITAFKDTAEEIYRAGAFTDVPLTVITAAKRVTFGSPPEILETVEMHQKDLSKMSPQGKQLVARSSGHYIQNTEPEVVIAAVKEIFQENRNREYERVGFEGNV